MTQKSMLSQLFGGATTRNPLVVNPALRNPESAGAWLATFRISNIEQSRGRAMSAVKAFDSAMENSEQVTVVQSAFLTACTVIDANLGQIEQASLLNSHRAAKARESIADLLQESKVAYNRLGTRVSQAVALDQYSSISTSAHARLVALYEYLESITNGVALTETLPNRNIVQFPTGGPL